MGNIIRKLTSSCKDIVVYKHEYLSHFLIEHLTISPFTIIEKK